MTIAEAYFTGVQQLRSRDGEGEARAIIRRVLHAMTGVSSVHLLQPERVLNAAEESAFSANLQQLDAGLPLPYLLNHVEFYGLDFWCDARALIPRGETELLVELALRELKNIAAPCIADMGTGTGCIAISLAHERADANVIASDLSADARELARENAEKNGVAERVRFVAGEENSWAAPLRPFAPFDAILSNPPYIASAEIETLQTSVRTHEPRLALDGGADGLNPYRQIAAQCGELLKPNGFLACELGAGQFDDIQQIFEACDWRVSPPIFDFGDHARVLLARR
ncbi:MAG TPA: peptide chain release factor N(5)-glutamine methyltransferase [Abditibacteriaceae bacterium]|jgi:release factor glutamine methyltransferase